MLSQQFREQRHNPLIRQEEIVGITELPLGLKGPEVGLKLGETQDLRNRNVFGFDLGFCCLGVEIGVRPVVDDETELGIWGGVERMRERDFVGVCAAFWWYFLQGENEVDKLILVLIQELWLLGF